MQDRKAWWRERVKRHSPLWFASIPVNNLAQDTTPNWGYFSSGFGTGVRYFAFTDEKTRDLFVDTFRHAAICEDPCP